jgi:hypothetical protein
MGLANRSEFLKKSKDPYRKHHVLPLGQPFGEVNTVV